MPSARTSPSPSLTPWPLWLLMALLASLPAIMVSRSAQTLEPDGPLTAIGLPAPLLSSCLLLAVLVWAGLRVHALRAIQTTARRMAGGDTTARVPTPQHTDLGDLAHSINTLCARLEHMENAHRTMMSELTRVVRPPLDQLQQQADALVTGVSPPTAEALARLKQTAASLQQRVEDWQLQDPISPLHPSCRLAPHDASHTLARLISLHQPAAREAGLTLGWAKTPPRSVWIWWDRARIERVLNDLLLDSLQCTPSPGHITVDLRHTAHCVQITIEDGPARLPAPTGSSSPHAADPPPFRLSHGRGQHLTMDSAIVNAHGGLLSALPSSLGGLRIDIDLPIHPDTTA